MSQLVAVATLWFPHRDARQVAVVMVSLTRGVIDPDLLKCRFPVNDLPLDVLGHELNNETQLLLAQQQLDYADEGVRRVIISTWW